MIVVRFDDRITFFTMYIMLSKEHERTICNLGPEQVQPSNVAPDHQRITPFGDQIHSGTDR